MGVKFYHARSWELTNKGQIEVPKSPLCSVGICWPKILVNAAWFMEWWEGKPQREWVFHVLIPRGVPICNGRAGVFSSWYQVGGLTAPWLLKHLGTGSLEHSPDETELKTSVQNVLRHLYHCVHPHGCAQVLTFFLYIHHLVRVALLFFMVQSIFGAGR